MCFSNYIIINVSYTPSSVDCTTLLSLIKGCYDNGRYSDCIDWSYKLLPQKGTPDSHEGHTALLYRGKAFFQSYKQEQRLLEDPSNHLSVKELHLKQEAVYDTAGNVVRDLGKIMNSDPSLLDQEASKYLDISMIDIAVHRNGLKEYSRCLLCLKVKALRKSHLCPKAILDAFASGLNQTQNKRIFNLSFFKRSQIKSPKEVTLQLFCDSCENILSKDGETHFIPKFFKRLYNINSPSQPDEALDIQYGEWLYQFALGLIFRGLINEAISSFVNDDEIYNIFAKLRTLILAEKILPDKPDIHLLVSPTTTGDSAGLIGHIHHAPFVFALTNISLKAGLQIFPRKCQFFLARIGIMNFILTFGKKTLLSDETLINPDHGEFRVLPENERSSAIPKGIVQILENLAVDTEKNLFESTVSSIHQLRLKEPAPPQDQKSDTFMLYDAIKTDFSQQGVFPTKFSIKSPQSFNFLPPGFELDHNNGSLALPKGHKVIFHGDFLIEEEANDNYNVTFFLAAGIDDVYSLEKPYIIFHRYQPGLKLQLGFFVSPDDLSPRTILPDPNPKVFIHKAIQQLQVPGLTNRLLPDLMKLRGLRSCHSVLHRFFLNRYITYSFSQ